LEYNNTNTIAILRSSSLFIKAPSCFVKEKLAGFLETYSSVSLKTKNKIDKTFLAGETI
jgi:hypothetical protein